MCTHRGGAAALGIPSASQIIAQIQTEADAEQAAFDAAQNARAAAAAAADAAPLSDAAQAVIARMTSRHHIHMSWARPYVRDDNAILQAVRQQVPGATGFTIRSAPDARGYADVEAEIDPRAGLAISGRMMSPAIAAMSSSQQRRLMRQPVQYQSIRVRIIKNSAEE